MSAPLLTIIHELFATDQALRHKLARSKDRELVKHQMLAQDALNTTKLKELISRYGWSRLVEDGGNELWHLVQHSDHNVEFQIEALAAFRSHHPCSIKEWQCAFLKDRICMNQGRPQIYGSQLQKSKTTGLWEIYHLEDPDDVDFRRAKVGLAPLEEYLKQMNQ